MAACAGSLNATALELYGFIRTDEGADVFVGAGALRAPGSRASRGRAARVHRGAIAARDAGRRICGGCRHEGTAPWLQGPDRSGCRHCPVLVAYGPKGCLYWRHRPGGNIVAGRRAGKPGGRVRLRGRGYRVYRIAVLIATASGRPPGVSRKTCRLRWPDWARGTSEPGGAVSVALVSRRQPDAPQGIPTTDA